MFILLLLYYVSYILLIINLIRANIFKCAKIHNNFYSSIDKQGIVGYTRLSNDSLLAMLSNWG